MSMHLADPFITVGDDPFFEGFRIMMLAEGKLESGVFQAGY